MQDLTVCSSLPQDFKRGQFWCCVQATAWIRGGVRELLGNAYFAIRTPSQLLYQIEDTQRDSPESAPDALFFIRQKLR